MSLNQAVKANQNSLGQRPLDQGALRAADFIFATLVHLLVVSVVLILNWWQPAKEHPPLLRIEVQMISAKELAKLQQPTHAAKPKPVEVKQPPKIEPKPEVKPEVKLAPVPKLEPKAKKPVKVVEDDFDPFAPAQSKSDVTTPKKAPRNDMADIMGKQLSQQETEQYIAMMRDAVQKRWKVPAGVDASTPDPLVEMVLNRNGTVASARIIESSGNTALDQTLISAIYAAAPFQLPKQQFEVFRTNQIRFRPLK